MKKYPEVDIYVPIEGEAGFANTVQRILDSESSEKIQKKRKWKVFISELLKI